MNDNQARAIIAVELLAQDNNKQTPDYYLGKAQEMLVSSYKNYVSPVDDQAAIDQAASLLVRNGYVILPPGSEVP